MNNKKLLLGMAAIAVAGVLCFQMLTAKKKSRKRYIPVPRIGVQYSLGTIYDLITMSKKTSKFFRRNGNPATDLTTFINQDENNRNLNVTLYYDHDLIGELVSAGRLRDKENDKKAYTHILLKFQVKDDSGQLLFNGDWFYLNDPHPGKVKTKVGLRRGKKVKKRSYPAKKIWRKWKIKKGSVLEYAPVE